MKDQKKAGASSQGYPDYCSYPVSLWKIVALLQNIVGKRHALRTDAVIQPEVCCGHLPIATLY